MVCSLCWAYFSLLLYLCLEHNIRFDSNTIWITFLVLPFYIHLKLETASLPNVSVMYSVQVLHLN